MEYDNYRKLLEERRSWYKTIKKVYCPCLKTDIVFNSKGFNHIKYDGYGKERSIVQQILRLNLLPLVVPVIKQATSIKEHRLSKDKNTEYWALEECVGKHRLKIRVILMKKTGGSIIYFSVMGMRKQKDRHIP